MAETVEEVVFSKPGLAGCAVVPAFLTIVDGEFGPRRYLVQSVDGAFVGGAVPGVYGVWLAIVVQTGCLSENGTAAMYLTFQKYAVAVVLRQCAHHIQKVVIVVADFDSGVYCIQLDYEAFEDLANASLILVHSRDFRVGEFGEALQNFPFYAHVIFENVGVEIEAFKFLQVFL